MRRTFKETLLTVESLTTTTTCLTRPSLLKFTLLEDGTDLTDGAAAAAVNEYCVHGGALVVADEQGVCKLRQSEKA